MNNNYYDIEKNKTYYPLTDMYTNFKPIPIYVLKYAIYLFYTYTNEISVEYVTS